MGNGCLGMEVRDEVICRNEGSKQKEAAVVSRKKIELRNLISPAKLIKDKMKDKNSKLTTDNLCLLVTFKKRKRDVAIPSGKAALLLDGMKLSTALHHSVAQTIPNLRRKKKKWRRRSRELD